MRKARSAGGVLCPSPASKFWVCFNEEYSALHFTHLLKWSARLCIWLPFSEPSRYGLKREMASVHFMAWSQPPIQRCAPAYAAPFFEAAQVLIRPRIPARTATGGCAMLRV